MAAWCHVARLWWFLPHVGRVRLPPVIIAGIAVGIVASLAAGRVLASMLYEIGANDVTTFVGVTVLLAAIGTLATWLPARRAARIDPIEALESR